MSENKASINDYIFLHAILLLYSLTGIFSKLASQNEFLSFKFIVFYGLALMGLFIYAILWQQVLKKLPLTTAFANKSITVVWGMFWGTMFFREKISLFMIIGAVIIIGGIYLVVTDHE